MSASSGALRPNRLGASPKQKAREKSTTLSALFDGLPGQAQTDRRSENYVKQFRWLRGYLDFWLETKVSDLTPGNIKFSLQKLPSGNFNSNFLMPCVIFKLTVSRYTVID